MNLPLVTVKNRVRNYEKKIKNKEPVLVRKKKNPEKKVPQNPEKKEVKKQKKKIPKKKRQPDTTKLLMKLAKDLDIKINKTNVEMKNLQRMIRKRLRSLYKK
jgi:hypothetical protein